MGEGERSCREVLPAYLKPMYLKPMYLKPVYLKPVYLKPIMGFYFRLQPAF